MSFKHLLSVATLGGLSSAALMAGVTYVDADFAANTAPGSASTTTVAADGLWAKRANGTNITVFEASGNSGAEDALGITTTLTGLTPLQSYKVWVNFYDPSGTTENWNIRAGFNTGSLTLFANNAVGAFPFTTPVLASSLTYTGTPPKFDDGSNRLLQAGEIGTAAADANGNLVLFIDDAPAAIGSNNRTWYDGISYEPVTAPSSDAITYLDASASNITRHDGQPFAPAAQGNTTIDNNWETRILGNNGTVFESNADGPEDAPLLVTLVTGLTPSTDYVLYAYFWDDGRNWRLKASANASDIQDNATPGNLSDDFLPTSPRTHFGAVGNTDGTATDAPAAVAGDFVTPPMLTEGNRTLHQASLGKFTSTPNGNLRIYIDDLAGAGEADRVWFDGVGTKLALPLVSGEDEDSDGLSNGEEVTAGTNPYIADTDGDTYSDGTEVAAGSNPLDKSSIPPLPGNSLAITPDGAWTWFNDERAIFHQGSLFIGYVKGNGQTGVTRYDPATNESHDMIISTATSQQQDDHNNPSFTVLPNGNLMALYSKHRANSNFYQRTSLVNQPSSNSDWGPEIVRPLTTAYGSYDNTYNNAYLLSGESNRIYNFHRYINFNPTITISDDLGTTWQQSIPLIEVGSGSVRPYPRYCSNGTDRIDLIYTDGHPRDEDNSVYHMFYQADAFFKTDGTLIDSFANLPLDHQAGQRGSTIYQFSSAAWGPGQGPDDWIPNARGWTWDVTYGKDGNPVCAFQAQIGTDATWSTSRIYYYYARWTGTSWQKKFIAQAGRGIYAAESDYGGGMCIDPENPDVVYISTNAANPFDLGDINKVPLAPNARFEIYKGVTQDGGLTFQWTPITSNSKADNLRPIIPATHGYDQTLLWLNGTYNSYTNFQTRILALLKNHLKIETSSFSPSTNSATLSWSSSPGWRYRITGSSDLTSFPYAADSGIDSQGRTTTREFTFPAPLRNASSAFFRVEEE